jgi:hypothetical protein
VGGYYCFRQIIALVTGAGVDLSHVTGAGTIPAVPYLQPKVEGVPARADPTLIRASPLSAVSYNSPTARSTTSSTPSSPSSSVASSVSSSRSSSRSSSPSSYAVTASAATVAAAASRRPVAFLLPETVSEYYDARTVDVTTRAPAHTSMNVSPGSRVHQCKCVHVL